MSARIPSHTLATAEGELVLIRVSVEPHWLEKLLETLALLPFAINPQIIHGVTQGGQTAVEFPAYASWQPDVRSALIRSRLVHQLNIRPMLEQLRLAC